MRMNDILILTSVDFKDYFNFKDFWDNREDFFRNFDKFCVITPEHRIWYDIVRSWAEGKIEIEKYKLLSENIQTPSGDYLYIGNIDKSILDTLYKQYDDSTIIGICSILNLTDEAKGSHWGELYKDITHMISPKEKFDEDKNVDKKGFKFEDILDGQKKSKEQSPNNIPLTICVSNNSEYNREVRFRGKTFTILPGKAIYALVSTSNYCIDVSTKNHEYVENCNLPGILQNTSCSFDVIFQNGVSEKVIWKVNLPNIYQCLYVTDKGRLINIEGNKAEIIAKYSANIAEELYKRIRKDAES